MDAERIGIYEPGQQLVIAVTGLFLWFKVLTSK